MRGDNPKLAYNTNMRQLPENWESKDGKLVRQFEFDDFKQALSFINNVGEIAERQNHHPDIYNSYNKVELKCSTHDSDSITIQDYALAEAINALK